EASMPPGENSTECEGECATDLAAYLWSLRTELEEPDSLVRGQALMEGSMCAGCHADNGDGTFGTVGTGGFYDVNALRLSDTEATLAAYLHEFMPIGANTVNCEGRCATDLAGYLWSLRTDAEQPDPVEPDPVEPDPVDPDPVDPGPVE